MEFIKREDNLKEYLKSEAEGFLFTELDDNFLKTSGLEFLSKVPVPIKNEDLKDIAEAGLSTTVIADNMAVVLGADYTFKYAESYIRYLSKLFDEKLLLVFASKANDLIEKKQLRKAMCYLRTGMLIGGESLEAMFPYANACRIWYLSLEGEDEEKLISTLKAEALEYFAEITTKYPEFAPAWYYLGYAYLNSGAYQKAQLSFRHYLTYSEGQPEADIKEVKERLETLEDPVRIEAGRNLLIEGKYEEALNVLEPYASSDFSRWWPLHFYLGLAYRALGYKEEAIEGFLKVLNLNPSNYDAMIALSELYDEVGDEEKADKYRKKAKLVIQ